MLTVIARYKARADAAEAVAEVLRRHAEESRGEEGCLAFQAYRSTSSPEWFLLHEEYVDEAAFEEHRASPHFRRYVDEAIVPHLEERLVDRYGARVDHGGAVRADQRLRAVSDPYETGTYTWWHLSSPSPELCEAIEDGWLGTPGLALDVGCGLGSDAAHLARIGWDVVAIDLSSHALRAAAREMGPLFLRADLRWLPLRPSLIDVALDRGCFHYLDPEDRHRYAGSLQEALRPGGRLLLRASLRCAGVRNDIDEAVLERTFSGWHIDSLELRSLPSDTRLLETLVVKLRAPVMSAL